MFKKVMIVLGVLLAAFLAAAAMQPGDFHIQRSAVVDAPPAKVFAIVNDLHRWNEWSPWAKMDPNMKVTFEGPAKGVGASESWAGNSKVGEGKMTIVESQAPSKVGIKLEFLKPMKALNDVEFTMVPQGKGTQVTWSMKGRHNFIGKVFSLVMDIDKMVGADFERGLESLKGLAAAK